MAEALKKLLIIFYLIILGFSWLQLPWFFGITSVGGLVLTPSSYPYIPPLSLIVTVPTNTCEGWSVYFVNGTWLGLFEIHVPVVHYFSGRYEIFNMRASFGSSVLDNIKHYIEALIWPEMAAVPYNHSCAARVIFIIPSPIVLISFAALGYHIYYRFRRVW
ncbi:hypothetical protein TTSV1_gp15 [Thermoproteus tenax spherical virus 1]|uniref:Transmembrane protein n=1 Tax=Thermoproteus tenax spherical virus 1 TaxID=292639 RepID=Q647E7_9VIRU|nr:hypothetical protein TTSV1_gp15 [Thermoproteus tenax spherical virus 1]AAU25965.1 hypothetical protein [Thermoproteus tenax spherical virus 1]